jgi:hydroxymethylglutaryl-CoA synthase
LILTTRPVGIHAFGGYVPRLRLQRQAVYAALGWFNPGLGGIARGERAIASWDEDAITMAVEAARDCLGDRDRETVGRVTLASTSFPNADRQNSTIVKEALNLPDEVAAFDVAGSQRAGSSALLDACYAAAGGAGTILCIASERAHQRPGSEGELTGAHAAGAVLIAPGEGAALFIGAHSVSIDFVDRFRAAGERFDYHWESRWVRDVGYGEIAVQTVKSALEKLGLAPGDIQHFVMGTAMRGANAVVAKGAGVDPGAVSDTLAATLGDAGAAQPLVLLSQVLERAGPNETIMVVGFGGGCDVLVFRTTPAIAAARPARGIVGSLQDRKSEDRYVKYLASCGLLQLERGMRAEFDQKPVLTALYRERKTVLGLVGGRCTQTGTIQFPKTPISVATDARAIRTQVDYPLAECPARIISYTVDHLTYSPDPPAYYGGVEFEGGARLVTEFAEIDADEVKVGLPMRMAFRIKAFDERRGFTKYFWKAVPDRGHVAAARS